MLSLYDILSTQAQFQVDQKVTSCNASRAVQLMLWIHCGLNSVMLLNGAEFLSRENLNYQYKDTWVLSTTNVNKEKVPKTAMQISCYGHSLWRVDVLTFCIPSRWEMRLNNYKQVQSTQTQNRNFVRSFFYFLLHVSTIHIDSHQV